MTGSVLNDPAHLIEVFGRHVVGLCIGLSDLDPDGHASRPRYSAVPGTLLLVQEHCLYLTAGHVLSQLEAGVSAGALRIDKSYLADIFGGGRVSDHPIPFDFAASLRWHIDDRASGLDFGLIYLEDHEVRLLQANNIIPIRKEDITKQAVAVPGATHFLFGFPADLTALELTADRALSVAPTLLPVTKLDDPPPDVSDKSLPRFYGKIDGDLPFGIHGMSGGPIFAVSPGVPTRYRVVALQSSWYQQSSIIAACPLSIVAKAIDVMLAKAPPPK